MSVFDNLKNGDYSDAKLVMDGMDSLTHNIYLNDLQGYKIAEDPYSYITNITFKIMLDINENYEYSEEIGHIMLSVIDNDETMEFPFFEVLDDIEQELCDLGNAICTSKGNIKKQFKSEYSEKYAYFDRIYIKPEYRGFGIGSHILKHLYHIIGILTHDSLNIGRIFLCAFPTDLVRDKQGEIIDKGEYKKSYFRLKKLYRKCGFQQIKSTRYFTNCNYDK